jgi:hypothetical protein
MRNEAALQHVKLLGGVCLLSFGLGACGGAPVPHERMASAEAAARSAQEVGAQSSPQAALHLKLAQEQIALAKQLVEKGENERADFVLIRAKADAELALALAKEATAKQEAQRALDQVKSMQGGGS